MWEAEPPTYVLLTIGYLCINVVVRRAICVLKRLARDGEAMLLLILE